MPQHVPILVDEALAVLQPERGGLFVDATVGLGGHSQALLERAGRPFRLIGLDRDEEALALAGQRLGERAELHSGSFAELGRLLRQAGVGEADGILMDIGISSYQLDTAERGFSYTQDGPLDMRMDRTGGPTAAAILNGWSEYRLAELFFRYGEERLSRKIARAVIARRSRQPFERTSELAELVASAYPPALRHRHPHPATRVFQALRIEVNQELAALDQGMEQALGLLAPAGVLAIITFHSLEDRLVKHRFRQAVAEGGYELLTKKPVLPGPDELAANPRSRSAKLRAIRRAAAR